MAGDTQVLATGTEASNNGETRRDFMVLTASAIAGIGGAVAMWPFVDSLNPSADVLALASIEVDISSVQPGQSIKVMWRGKPVFVRRRTPEEVATEKEVNLAELVDPEPDSARVKAGHEEWLITVGVCTHLGCVPLVNQGEYNGWFCPCHGSSYDVSGRIRKGPAPKNLVVPEYAFISDTVVRIG